MNRAVYRHLLATYGRNPGQWVGFLAEAIRAFVSRVLIVILMAQVATKIAAGDIDGAKKYTLYFLIVYIAGSVIGTVGSLVAVKTENDEYRKLAMKYYDKLVNKDMMFYRDHQTGYLASTFRQYLDGAMTLVRFLRGEALATVISLIVPAIVLLWVSVPIGCIAIAILVIQLVYLIWSSSKANKYRQISNEIYRKITGEVSDEVTNIVAFKSGGIEDIAQSRVDKLSRQETQAFWHRRKMINLLDLPRAIVTVLGIAAAIYVVVDTAGSNNPATLGLMVLTLTYMFQIVRNVSVLPDLIVTHDDLVTKIYPTLEYLNDDYEEIRNPDNPVELKIDGGAISIEKVSFSYLSHAKNKSTIPVFSELSIEIKAGEQVGVVGLSGAGKSTLANLLLRFDEIDSGTISIDGTNIKDVRQEELRRNIAYVPQEPLLFHRTIRENITYYNPDAPESDILAAAKAAHAHEFINKLPDGYETMVGERGIKLSGGQKQRIAIARAILKKAPIMLFDEATSALDSESEQIIQKALPEIIGKKTAMIVAHRLSTVAGLDRIIVMHNGKITEEGTHDELVKMRGRYYALWQKQTSGS